MLALVLGSGTARRLESVPTGANEPSGMGQVKPGRRTATARFQGEPRLLFLYHLVGATRRRFAASHFRLVCAARITQARPKASSSTLRPEYKIVPNRSTLS
jgi:hypothetical protein